MKDKISINVHSSIKISDDLIIYFDPFKIEDDIHDADIIFITHDHYDHYDVESIKKVMNDNTKIVIPDRMATFVLGTFGPCHVIGVIPNEVYDIEGIMVETVPSYNVNKEYHPKSNNWVGYIITLNDERIYVAGDTDMNSDNEKVNCDIALIPIGGTYTCDYIEGASFVNEIKPKVVIPTHYGSIVGDVNDGEKFKELIASNIECKLLIK